jgi:hypothetical protein
MRLSTGELTPEAYADIWDRVKSRTMVPQHAVLFAAVQAVRVAEAGIPGAIVECGVWRGGCAMAMLLAQRHAFGEVRRPVYLFDSFEGLPPVDDRDGPAAAAYQTNVSSPIYYDNCRAELLDVTAGLQDLGFSEGEYHLVKGWFADSLVAADRLFGDSHIAVLRLDGDWYESTTTCLERLMPHVSEGGTVIVDDYYSWDGCARALHDYLSRHDQPYRIMPLPGRAGVFFIKRESRAVQPHSADDTGHGEVRAVTAPRSHKDMSTVTTAVRTLHPTLFEQNLDGLIKVKRIEEMYPFRLKNEDGEEGYLQYSNDWWLTPGCPHAFKYFDIDGLYPSAYFAPKPDQVHPTEGIAKSLYGYMQEVFKAARGSAFTSVLELGTGGGEITAAFRDAALDYIAVEGTLEGGRRLTERGIPADRVISVDLRRMQPLGRTFDLVMCTEVIEHIEPFFASKIIELCTVHADAVWFSAADRNRRPHIHHMNEQAIEVWDNLFAFLGFSISLELDNRFSRASRLYLRSPPSETQHPA